MKEKLLRGVILSILGLIFCAPAIMAQNSSTAGKALALTGKVPVIIVGQTAKITYKTAGFAAKEIVLPVAKETLKTIVLKAAPKLSLLLLKETGKASEKAIPIAGKLAVKYVKYRLTGL